jgi:hypothetical protein
MPAPSAPRPRQPRIPFDNPRTDSKVNTQHAVDIMEDSLLLVYGFEPRADLGDVLTGWMMVLRCC